MRIIRTVCTLLGVVGAPALAQTFTWDTSFGNPGPFDPAVGSDAAVWALEVYDGKLWIGGDFKKHGTIGNPHSIAIGPVRTWNGSFWSAASTGLPTPCAVGALEVCDGDLYATVYQDPWGSLEVYRWDTTTWTDVTSDLPQRGVSPPPLAFTEPLYAFDNGSTTKLIAGIWSEQCDEMILYELADDGTWDSIVATGMPQDVGAEDLIAYDRGSGPRLIVSTLSTDHCEQSDEFNSVWAIESGDWFDLPFPMDDGLCAFEVDALPFGGLAFAEFEGDLYAGGWPATGPGTCPNVSYIYVGNSDLTSWSYVGNPTEDAIGAVSAMSVYSVSTCDWLIVGGSIGELNDDNGDPCHLAGWDGSQWFRLGDSIAPGSNTGVYAIMPYNGYVYVGGKFADADGNAVRNIARFSATCDAMPDGVINERDVIEFTNSYLSGEGVDLSPDGRIDILDYCAFLRQWSRCHAGL